MKKILKENIEDKLKEILDGPSGIDNEIYIMKCKQLMNEFADDLIEKEFQKTADWYLNEFAFVALTKFHWEQVKKKEELLK